MSIKMHGVTSQTTTNTYIYQRINFQLQTVLLPDQFQNN
jgi:hypothetical protein